MTEQACEPKPNRMKRQRLAMITVERPRCPSCGGVKLRKYRTLADQGDGSALWWVRCACGRPRPSGMSHYLVDAEKACELRSLVIQPGVRPAVIKVTQRIDSTHFGK